MLWRLECLVLAAGAAVALVGCAPTNVQSDTGANASFAGAFAITSAEATPSSMEDSEWSAGRLVLSGARTTRGFLSLESSVPRIEYRVLLFANFVQVGIAGDSTRSPSLDGRLPVTGRDALRFTLSAPDGPRTDYMPLVLWKPDAAFATIEDRLGSDDAFYYARSVSVTTSLPIGLDLGPRVGVASLSSLGEFDGLVVNADHGFSLAMPPSLSAPQCRCRFVAHLGNSSDETQTAVIIGVVGDRQVALRAARSKPYLLVSLPPRSISDVECDTVVPARGQLVLLAAKYPGGSSSSIRGLSLGTVASIRIDLDRRSVPRE